jgi:hypothetical protein
MKRALVNDSVTVTAAIENCGFDFNLVFDCIMKDSVLMHTFG